MTPHFIPAALRKASFTRVCLLAPVARKWSSTSASTPSLLASLGHISGGRPRRRIRSSAGGLSGSAIASAVMAASSSVLIASSDFIARRRASSIFALVKASFEILDIGSDLSFVGLAQRNDMAVRPAHRGRVILRQFRQHPASHELYEGRAGELLPTGLCINGCKYAAVERKIRLGCPATLAHQRRAGQYRTSGKRLAYLRIRTNGFGIARYRNGRASFLSDFSPVAHGRDDIRQGRVYGGSHSGAAWKIRYDDAVRAFAAVDQNRVAHHVLLRFAAGLEPPGGFGDIAGHARRQFAVAGNGGDGLAAPVDIVLGTVTGQRPALAFQPLHDLCPVRFNLRHAVAPLDAPIYAPIRHSIQEKMRTYRRIILREMTRGEP